MNKYTIKNIEKFESFYNSRVEQLERFANKPILTYSDGEKIEALENMIDTLSVFFKINTQVKLATN